MKTRLEQLIEDMERCDYSANVNSLASDMLTLARALRAAISDAVDKHVVESHCKIAANVDNFPPATTTTCCPKCGALPLADDGDRRVLCEPCNKWYDVVTGKESPPPKTTKSDTEGTTMAAKCPSCGVGEADPHRGTCDVCMLDKIY